MNWNSNSENINRNGIVTVVIQPRPITKDDNSLIENWRAYFEANSSIPDDFFAIADEAINNMHHGTRGINWEYAAIDDNSNWPDQIIIFLTGGDS